MITIKNITNNKTNLSFLTSFMFFLLSPHSQLSIHQREKIITLINNIITHYVSLKWQNKTCILYVPTSFCFCFSSLSCCQAATLCLFSSLFRSDIARVAAEVFLPGEEAVEEDRASGFALSFSLFQIDKISFLRYRRASTSINLEQQEEETKIEAGS